MIYDTDQHNNAALQELREIFRYQNFIGQLARRDILTRYKRSILGVAWTMLNPLGMMVVMTLAFSQLFSQVPGYPAYILSGLVVWTFFSQTTTAAMVNLVWGGGLLNRIYIPRTSFAIAAIITGLFNLVLSLITLLLVMIVIGLPVRISILFLPYPMVLLAAFSLGVGLLISTLAVYFPDVSEMYQILMMAWMYLTPIFYPESILPKTYGPLLIKLNPIYYLLRLFRACIYEGRFPAPAEIWPATIIALVVMVAGWYLFSKKSDEFAYRI